MALLWCRVLECLKQNIEQIAELKQFINKLNHVSIPQLRMTSWPNTGQWYGKNELEKNFCSRAAFKFGRRVHFALRRKMLKPPIARLPAIQMDFINRPSEETDCIYETKVK